MYFGGSGLSATQLFMSSNSGWQRYSGVTPAASVAHDPPFARTARSRIVGVPSFSVNRSRTSRFFSPSHVTVSVLSATAAVRPGCAL